jgi:5-hydroxyisourate hydrolase
MRSGKLTTHVLDTARGRPGSAVAIALYRMRGLEREFIAGFTTNVDGRCDTPLLEGSGFAVGIYEMDFAIGDYFASIGNADALRFLDVVPIVFVVEEPAEGYHVPLLATPWSYSTYRGS